MTKELITIEKNKNYGLVVSSRVIAKELGKLHKNIIRDLDNISESSNVSSLIIPSTYKVENNNKTYKQYLLTKDGFVLYMFNIQGYNDFKMAYIKKFNEMEKKLKEKEKLPLTFKERKIITYKGIPVMDLHTIAYIANETVSKIYYRAKKFQITCLKNENLKEYKQENNLTYKQHYQKLYILYKNQIVELFKELGIYKKVKSIIENYFRLDNEIEYNNEIAKDKNINDKYWESIFESMREAYNLESKIEKIYKEELEPVYNHIISLIEAKKTMLGAFNCMKYGNIKGIE